MSMYNMVNGVHPTAGFVLEWLGIDVEDCGRFRDAYITKGANLAIYTRCGGGNRDDYEHIYDRFKKHPNYLYNEDDDYDETYSTFYFTVPIQYISEVNEYFELLKERNREDLLDTPGTRFKALIESMVNGETIC